MHEQMNMLVTHLTTAQLEAGLDDIRRSPRDAGELKLIVRRPRTNERELLDEASLDLVEGLAGDTWRFRASSRSADKKSPHPVIDVTSQPHTGCGKFVERFGLDAMKFVNSPVGRQLNLRGINARVVQAGTIRRGELARKL